MIARLFDLIVNNLVALTSLIVAAWLAYEGLAGWPWFLLVAIAGQLSIHLSNDETRARREEGERQMDRDSDGDGGMPA